MFGDFKKLESVFCWIKNKNYEIVLHQETHCVTNKEDVWQIYAGFSFCWINCSKLIFSGTEL